MRQYALKKLLLIIPSLFLLSVIVFFLSKLAPGDPVTSLDSMRQRSQTDFNTPIFSENYRQAARELGLDLPLFYISIQPFAYPDTFYRIVHPLEKKVLKGWLQQSPDWNGIQAFLASERSFIDQLSRASDSIQSIKAYRSILQQLKYIDTNNDLSAIDFQMNEISDSLVSNQYFSSPEIATTFSDLLTSYKKTREQKADWYDALPVIRFHGWKNQYHRWLGKILSFDLGLSAVDAQKVKDKIGTALFWTLLYVFTAYLFSLLIAIPTGLFTAWYHNHWIEKWISAISFAFYAFPLFWISTLAVVFLTNDLYSPWLHWFPEIGIGKSSHGMNLFTKGLTALPHLILPALILSLHSAAGGIRIIRNSAIVELKSDYFVTAKAKGLKNGEILVKHIFPNAMLPVITMLVSGFPAALAGSVVIEVIFNIPGLGRLLYDSIHYMDWNVVFAILLFIGLFTFIFYLLGDLLYAYLNPKIRYD